MSGPPVFTIGYEGSTQSAVLAALREAGVAHLIDIRAVAASRKPGLSKRLLCASVEAAGMRYTHLRALGTPKAGREAVRRGDPATMHRIFRAHLLEPEAQVELAKAGVLARESPVCLLCFEADPTNCHRSIVAEMLGRQTVHLHPVPLA
jgi:uncharacterized protein (DUF488 family)